MDNKPTISVLMPVYNGEMYLGESIQSLLCQSYTNFELIIINDASTDDSKNIALRYAVKDPRIVVIDNKYSKGLPGSLNSGIHISRGIYIARADADDINQQDRLELQATFLKDHSNIHIIGGGYQLFGKGREERKFHPQTSIGLAWRFISNTHFCHPSVMFRRQVLETVPCYPQVACEDFAFFSKIIQQHRGSNSRKILLKYRQHDNNYSNTQSESIRKSIKETFLKNFQFYTGSLEYADIFYDFHFNRELSLRNIFRVAKISFMISRKILRIYGIKSYSIQALCLYFIIKIDILVGLTPSLIKKSYRHKKIS